MWKFFCQILRFLFSFFLWSQLGRTFVWKGLIYFTLYNQFFFQCFFFCCYKIFGHHKFWWRCWWKPIFLTLLFYNLSCLCFPLVAEVTIWLLLTMLLDFQLICNLCSDKKCKKETLINELGDLLLKDHPVTLMIIASLFWSLSFVWNSYQLLWNELPVC